MENYKQILEAVNRGIKFALDDFDDNEQIQGQTNSKVKYNGGMKEWLLIEKVVNLGLPSGTLWCKHNLGVNYELDNVKSWYGKYYAWGELESKLKFNLDNYKFGKGYGNLTKYCGVSEYGLNGFTDNLTELLPEDDVAYQNNNIGNYKFHIPTKEQCKELIKYTKNYWVNNYDPNKVKHNPKNDNGIQKLNGRVFEGKNGNQLFIPAAGFHINSNIFDDGFSCNLWSSSLILNDPSRAYNLFFTLNNIGMSLDDRYPGFTIRPVINL